MTCSRCGAANSQAAKFCSQCGQQLAPQQLGRERRNVTILFVDLSGFSSLTRNWTPEALRDLADELLTVVAGIVEDYDGYVDAFQGDGLIALFGAPHSHHDDPQRAVLAAYSSLRAIEAIGRSKGLALKGCAGVNTGVVIAGAIGSGRVREYTVMGSAVNLAARIEAVAQPGEVWVGPETYAATRHRMLYEAVGGVSLAGFPTVTELYRLLSISDSDAGDPYAQLRFVGRASELACLQAAFDEACQQRQSQTVWVVGEAGIGKTRLVRTFCEQLVREQRASVLWCQEELYNTEQMWRKLASAAFSVSEDDPRLWQQRISEGVCRLLPDEPRWQRYILGSLGLLPTHPWRRIERRRIDRTVLAWRDLISAMARDAGDGRCLVLVVEHSSQHTPFSVLPDLLAESAAPLLIIRTSRKRELITHAKKLVLKPLSQAESAELVVQLANPLLKVATESLIAQVGGVPANLLELGRALSIAPQGSFSDSLASLLQARLDMLSPPARRLLALAALCGERAWENLIWELHGTADYEALRELLEAKLLLKEPTPLIAGQSEYRFQSELLRRAALKLIPLGERAQLHLRIASWLERHAPLNLSELVAEHFLAGGLPDAAYPYYLAAAELELGRERFHAAFSHYQKLLGLELPEPLRAQGALAYAQAALAAGEAERAAELLTLAAQLIGQLADERVGELQSVYQQLLGELAAKR